MYQDYAVGEHNANKGKRFLNLIIDYVFLFIMIYLIAIILGIIIALINVETTIFNDIENMNPLLDRIITSIVYVLLMFGFEALTKGRSLGKYITGTKVVMIDGSAPTTKKYFYRNLCRIIPFDAITFLAGNGWHDKISETTVVNKRAFEEELLKNNSIDEIGVAE